ncbi:MAG: AraC family transcriptional regulator [Ancalomicrobiaceae bacterium]|nr:AraC family transcriptional regulator [Ancalomicrobiaceae bacterium]
MNDQDPRIKEGFPGQRSVVLPRPVVAAWLDSDPLWGLLPSDVGYYPRAQWHFVARPEGIAQAVMIYCTDGEGWARFGETLVRVRPGQILITPPDVGHSYGAHESMPWTIYWVHLAGPKVATLTRLFELEAGATVLTPGRDPAIPPMFERIMAILGAGYTPDNLLSASMTLGQLVTHLVVTRHRDTHEDDNLDVRIGRVIETMQANLAKALRVTDLAAAANLSPSHFSAIFKKRTGFSSLDFFTRLKMQRACFLLDTTEKSIKAVAAELGFDDPLYFSRCFRRVHECSPLQYRAIRKG